MKTTSFLFKDLPKGILVHCLIMVGLWLASKLTGQKTINLSRVAIVKDGVPVFEREGLLKRLDRLFNELADELESPASIPERSS